VRLQRILAIFALATLTSSCTGHRAAKVGSPDGSAGTGGAGGDPGRDGGTGGVTVDAMGPTTDAMVPTADAMGPTADAMGPTADAMGPTGDAGGTVDAICPVTHQGTRVSSDLLLVFDRSGSMQEDPSTGQICAPQGTCPSKWNQAVAAIGQVVTSTQATIRWGLKLFQTGTVACTVTAGVQVPIAPMNAQAITNALALTAPLGSTPTTAAIGRAGDYLSTLTTPNPRYLLLVTDGQPTCAALNANAADDPAAIAEVANQAQRGFGTFVVGIATAGNTGADATLSLMSTNGLHPRAGTPNFYRVNDLAELAAALESIAALVGSCTFALDSVPPHPANVTVRSAGNVIPPSDIAGWVYAPGMDAIVLTGAYCDQVMSGAIQSIAAIFGC